MGTTVTAVPDSYQIYHRCLLLQGHTHARPCEKNLYWKAWWLISIDIDCWCISKVSSKIIVSASVWRPFCFQASCMEDDLHTYTGHNLGVKVRKLDKAWFRIAEGLFGWPTNQDTCRFSKVFYDTFLSDALAGLDAPTSTHLYRSLVSLGK